MQATIVVADDHQIFRRGIMALLETSESIKIIGEACDGKDALRLIAENPPNLLLLDLQMPYMDGFEVLKTLQEQKSPVRTIVLTMHNEEKDIIRAIEYGAKGFLSKNIGLDEILKALQMVADTGFYFNEHTNHALLNRVVNHKRLAGGFNGDKVFFSNKELSVLQLLSEELTNEEIGKRLFTSPRTVEGMRHEMIKKVGAKNIIGLFKYAYKNALVAV
jgi:DNA-binding NarL/FixJ family response regulator